jgi:hypothetical protein
MPQGALGQAAMPRNSAVDQGCRATLGSGAGLVGGTLAAGANPREVAARAGHASVSFTLDRYGHLYPEADTALRDRLDVLYGTAQPTPDGTVVRLPRRAGRGPSVVPGGPEDDESAADDAPTTL